MEVGLWEAGELSVFTTPGAKLAKPKDVQTMLASAGLISSFSVHVNGEERAATSLQPDREDGA